MAERVQNVIKNIFVSEISAFVVKPSTEIATRRFARLIDLLYLPRCPTQLSSLMQ